MNWASKVVNTHNLTAHLEQMTLENWALQGIYPMPVFSHPPEVLVVHQNPFPPEHLYKTLGEKPKP